MKLSNRLGKFKSNSFFASYHSFNICVTAFTFRIAAHGARTLDNASDQKDRAALFAGLTALLISPPWPTVLPMHGAKAGRLKEDRYDL